MKVYHDNSVRLERVKDREWREALDELTVYLGWRLYGKTETGAYSEKELGMPALTYYQEEAVVKLIEGEWKWQERFSLGKQLERIAASLITKQCEKYLRAHPNMTEDGRCLEGDIVLLRKPEVIVFTDDIERYGDVADEEDACDETRDKVFELVADDEELTQYVEGIVMCESFKELPGYLGISLKRCYRLQEKLMRRIRRALERGVLTFGRTCSRLAESEQASFCSHSIAAFDRTERFNNDF